MTTYGIQYTITLTAGDGTEWEWDIHDHYFKRQMKVVQKEMHEVIKEHDKTYIDHGDARGYG